MVRNPLPSNIMALPEDVQRALTKLVEAQEAMRKGEALVDIAMQDRDHYIVELRRRGWTVEQCAQFTGLSGSAIMKISKKQGVVGTRSVIATAAG